MGAAVKAQVKRMKQALAILGAKSQFLILQSYKIFNNTSSFFFIAPGRAVGARSNQRQEDWEKNQAVPDPKQYSKEEDLEEGEEKVGVAAEEEDEGDEG